MLKEFYYIIQSYMKFIKYSYVHKKLVLRNCFKKGLYLDGIVHDCSKLLNPIYFHRYALWMFHPIIGVRGPDSPKKDELRHKQKIVSDRHHFNSKHHWHYHIGFDMPVKDIEVMICDWEAVSEAQCSDLIEWYKEHYDDILLSTPSRVYLEYRLGLIDEDKFSGLTVGWSKDEEKDKE